MAMDVTVDPGSQLTPVRLLHRAAEAFPAAEAVVDGDVTRTFEELRERVSALAAVLEDLGVRPGDRVALLCSNSALMIESHFAVPAVPAVMVPLNTRLSHDEHLAQVQHAGVRCLIATREFGDRARELATSAGIACLIEGTDHEAAVASARIDTRAGPCEADLLSISYTSGTTGRPKGVMQTHRAAYLQANAMIVHSGLDRDARYLWTLPMFHCHGWGHTWAVTAAGGTHVCLRSFDPAEVWRHLDAGDVSHLSAAPTVITMLLAERPTGVAAGRRVRVSMGGAPPSPALVERMDRAGLTPHHLYGLTETLGPSLVNLWQRAWDALPVGDRARMHARQGVATLPISGVRIVGDDGADVPSDGTSSGELWLRGDTVTAGYFRDPEATEAAIVDGWLRTGDAAVRHADGYVEITDRLKDIIITGGENVSSVEVERAIDAFDGVVESAVVGAPHPLWGEQVVAFVTATDLDEASLIRHLRDRLAGFKMPRRFVYGDLPKTATGKVRKDVLRGRAGQQIAAQQDEENR